MRRSTVRYLVQAGVLASALRPSLAGAQSVPSENDAADVLLARELGNQGMAFAAKGDCASAVDPLSRSESLHHAPTTLTVLGDCHVASGALVQGLDELTRVVREVLSPQAPPAFYAAQERARQHLAMVLPRVPMLKIVVEGVKRGTPLMVTLDGKPMAEASLGIARPVDPHAHTVEAEARGYQARREEITLRESEAKTLAVTLEPLPSMDFEPTSGASSGGQETATGATPNASPPGRPPESTPRSRLPAYIAFGVGAVGLGAGAVLGAITLSGTSILDRECPTRSTCPASARSNITTTQTTATLSTIGFGVGAAGAILGTYFMIRSSSTRSAAAGAPGVVATPWIGLGTVGMGGSF